MRIGQIKLLLDHTLHMGLILLQILGAQDVPRDAICERVEVYRWRIHALLRGQAIGSWHNHAQ